jgi:hypothetical protein
MVSSPAKPPDFRLSADPRHPASRPEVP